MNQKFLHDCYPALPQLDNKSYFLILLCNSCHNNVQPCFALFKGLKNRLMAVIKWHMNFKSSHTTRPFAYSHLWHFITTNNPDKSKIREKINQKEQGSAGEGAGFPGSPGAEIKAS